MSINDVRGSFSICHLAVIFLHYSFTQKVVRARAVTAIADEMRPQAPENEIPKVMGPDSAALKI